jgi:hypothetical protein
MLIRFKLLSDVFSYSIPEDFLNTVLIPKKLEKDLTLSIANSEIVVWLFLKILSRIFITS